MKVLAKLHFDMCFSLLSLRREVVEKSINYR